jgi:hypothetical protein
MKHLSVFLSLFLGIYSRRSSERVRRSLLWYYKQLALNTRVATSGYPSYPTVSNNILV